jgi:hypothetical protein
MWGKVLMGLSAGQCLSNFAFRNPALKAREYQAGGFFLLTFMYFFLRLILVEGRDGNMKMFDPFHENLTFRLQK